jgi:hypothetical protein
MGDANGMSESIRRKFALKDEHYERYFRDESIDIELRKPSIEDVLHVNQFGKLPKTWQKICFGCWNAISVYETPVVTHKAPRAAPETFGTGPASSRIDSESPHTGVESVRVDPELRDDSHATTASTLNRATIHAHPATFPHRRRTIPAQRRAFHVRFQPAHMRSPEIHIRKCDRTIFLVFRITAGYSSCRSGGNTRLGASFS